MEDEIKGAKEYAVYALEYQQSRPQLADLYHQMSIAEMQHFSELHRQTENIIQDLKNMRNDIPQKMLNKWQEKHLKMIECQQIAQTYIDLYR